jgi:hypothetical protein
MGKFLVVLLLTPIAIVLAPAFLLALLAVFVVHLTLGPKGVLEARRRHLERCFARRSKARR